MSVKSRLERLERLEKSRDGGPDQERRSWLATMRARRVHENAHRGEYHAGDIFRLLRNRGEFEGVGFGAAVDRIRAWGRPRPGGRC